MMTEGESGAVCDICKHFQVNGSFLRAEPHGSGHINDTYLATYRNGTGTIRYIHQRINHYVFKEPEKMMANIQRVTNYARQRILEAGGDPQRETLTLIPAEDGKPYFLTPQGEYWRTYTFIDGARSYDSVEDPRQLYNAARAFGNFQKLLDSLPGERLHETIPDFHHTRKRFDTFVKTVEADPRNRAASVKPEIDFILQRAADASIVVDLLESGQIPERVTHNDTKLNNVLIDDQSGEGICVIDLDTTMPGSALYDFGDLVRMGATTGAEDEIDLTRVGIDLARFERLARGYLDAVRDFLTPQEIDRLAFAGKLITFEQSIRFLTDYIKGDVYYKIHRPAHNLDRTRAQLALVADLERKIEAMTTIITRSLSV